MRDWNETRLEGKPDKRVVYNKLHKYKDLGNLEAWTWVDLWMTWRLYRTRHKRLVDARAKKNTSPAYTKGSDFACLPHAQPAREPEGQSSTAVKSSDYQRAQKSFFIASV